MKGDFSRDSFNPEKHYTQVLMQQGRVQLDADWNEQQAINQHRIKAEALDTIGMTGAPKRNPGFRITPQGNNLLIGQGHYYVEGILCENEQDVLFTNQSDLPGASLPTQPGLYLAYLEVWQRHITSIEDQHIRETALGGPDTTTRLKTIWQVRLLSLTQSTGTVACDSPLPEWANLLDHNVITAANGGKLRARTQPITQSTQPSIADPLCVLPATAGYRRLENQLYRVEVHQGGTRATARFKWSRDNGTVSSRILSTATVNNGGNVSTEIVVDDLGKDDFLSFATDPLPEWVELTDDQLELGQQHGNLARVRSVDGAQRKVILEGATQTLSGQNPTLRRWDQRGTSSTESGMPMTGNWQLVEDGIEVRFSEGTYKAGDYWLIPARTAISDETGTIEWEAPLEKLPHGTPHRFARLALLQRNASGFLLIPNGDCRKLFPALTTIAAEDVGFNNTTCKLDNASTVQQAMDLLCQRSGSHCTLVVGPSDNLATALTAIGNGQDAHICFRVGTYTLPDSLRIENRGHLTIAGCGAGTRIIAPTAEAALVFVNCQSVSISHCHIESGRAETSYLNGAVTVINCPITEVEQTSLRCVGGALRAASCITVRQASPTSNSVCRIRHCDLEVGHQQIGILLVNQARIQVEDNLVRVGTKPTTQTLLKNVNYRAQLRRQLISNVRPAVAGAAPPAGTNATVTFNGQTVHFRSDPALFRSGNRNDTAWQQAIAALNPPRINTPLALQAFLEQFANQVLDTQGNTPGASQLFRNSFTAITQQDLAVLSQGIVVGGVFAADVRIFNNTIQSAIQGIHVGLSRREPSSTTTPAVAEVVQVKGNTIRVLLPVSATRERHGVFVGNCSSLLVEDNYLTLQRVSKNIDLRVEGIRIFGTVDRRVIVRHNHMNSGFNVGISFVPLNAASFPRPLWIITENVAVQSALAVEIPAKTASGGNGVPDPNAVRAKVRGIGDNFS